MYTVEIKKIKIMFFNCTTQPCAPKPYTCVLYVQSIYYKDTHNVLSYQTNICCNVTSLIEKLYLAHTKNQQYYAK